MVGRLGVVADVFLVLGVGVLVFGLVLAAPDHAVGADEHEAVDLVSQFGGEGGDEKGRGAAGGSWVVCGDKS